MDYPVVTLGLNSKAYQVLYHKFVDVVIVDFPGIKSDLLNIFLEHVPIHLNPVPVK